MLKNCEDAWAAEDTGSAAATAPKVTVELLTFADDSVVMAAKDSVVISCLFTPENKLGPDQRLLAARKGTPEVFIANNNYNNIII